MKTTKFKLFNAFTNGVPFQYSPNGGKMIINSIERESGNNLTYNISGFETWTKAKITFFVQCID